MNEFENGPRGNSGAVFISSPPENPVPLGAGMNGGKITHTHYI